MAKCHYCSREEQTAAEKAWSAAADKWNEYQCKEKIGWFFFGTPVVTLMFILLAVAWYPNALQFLGWAGVIITLFLGLKCWSAAELRARATFEKDFPEMAKLVR